MRVEETKERESKLLSDDDDDYIHATCDHSRAGGSIALHVRAFLDPGRARNPHATPRQSRSHAAAAVYTDAHIICIYDFEKYARAPIL